MTTWQDKIRSSTPKEEWFCLKHVMSRWLASQAFLSYTQPERPNSSSGKTGKKKISYCLLTTYELRVCLLTKKLKIKLWKNENPNSYVSELINPDSHCWRADLIDRIFMPYEASQIKSIPLSSNWRKNSLLWEDQPSHL